MCLRDLNKDLTIKLHPIRISSLAAASSLRAFSISLRQFGALPGGCGVVFEVQQYVECIAVGGDAEPRFVRGSAACFKDVRESASRTAGIESVERSLNNA